MGRRYGAAPERRSPDLLRRLLAWRIQSEAYKRPERRHPAGAARRAAPPTQAPAAAPGDRFVRERKGERHEVEILETEVAYRGGAYASLSEVARLITGAR